MTVYILLALVLFAFSFTKRKWALLISFILLFVVACFRDISVGTDTKNYESLFYSNGTETDQMYHAKEPLYLLLHFIVAYNGWDYSTLMFLSSAIVVILLFVFTIKESPNPNYSILCFFLLYYYFYSFNTVRQYQAMVFVLLAWHYQMRKNYKLYYIFIVLGTFFHYTALIGFLSMLIERVKLSANNQIAFLLLSYFLGITPIVKSILSVFFVFLPESFYAYISSSDDRELTMSISRLMLTLYIATLINLLRKNMWLKLLAFGVFALNLFAFQPVVGRITQYFTIVQIVIIPQIPFLIKKRKYTKILSTASVLYMFVVWLYLLLSNTAEVVPYKFGGIKLFY